MKASTFLCSAVAATALLSSAFVGSELNAQNLVADPGFEASTDNQTGGNPFSAAWTLVEPGGFSVVGGNAGFAHSGTNYANLAPAVGALGSLSQVLTTTAGSLYNLSFWLGNDVFSTTAFEVFWNGISVLALANLPENPALQPYTQFNLTNLTATGTSTTLEFRYRHDDDFLRLDDVSVSVVPEPSTISFAVLGLAGFGAAAYRRSKLRRTASR